MAETRSYDWKFVKSKYSIEYDPDKTFNFKIYNLGDDISNKNTPVANNFAYDLLRELLAAREEISRLESIAGDAEK